jgi:hypothetical protein
MSFIDQIIMFLAGVWSLRLSASKKVFYGESVDETLLLRRLLKRCECLLLCIAPIIA